MDLYSNVLENIILASYNEVSNLANYEEELKGQTIENGEEIEKQSSENRSIDFNIDDWSYTSTDNDVSVIIPNDQVTNDGNNNIIVNEVPVITANNQIINPVIDGIDTNVTVNKKVEESTKDEEIIEDNNIVEVNYKVEESTTNEAKTVETLSKTGVESCVGLFRLSSLIMGGLLTFKKEKKLS